MQYAARNIIKSRSLVCMTRPHLIHYLIPMTMLAQRMTRLAWGVLLLVFVASGCRMYGGYGSRAATFEKIQQATQRFAEDLERARGERDALQRAAAADPALVDFAERFAAVVERQGAMVAEHQALAADASAGGNILFEWVGPDNYRQLHSLYGAIISDQQIIEDRYDEVLMDLQQALGAMTPAERVPLQSRYQVAPHFYERIRYASGQRSVADILAQAPAAAAPVAEAPEEASE